MFSPYLALLLYFNWKALLGLIDPLGKFYTASKTTPTNLFQEMEGFFINFTLGCFDTNDRPAVDKNGCNCQFSQWDTLYILPWS